MQWDLLAVVKGIKKIGSGPRMWLWDQFDHSDAPEWLDHLMESDHVFVDEETQKTVVVIDAVAHVLTEAFWEAFPPKESTCKNDQTSPMA